MISCRVEICGGIASGKTTLATLLNRNGFDPIYENFKANPFWEAFYTVPDKYNFETEICFMLQHYHQIKRQSSESQNIACDYSFLLDLAYSEMGLRASQLRAFKSIYEEIAKELPPPTLVIHLQCDASIELERIRKRARAVEDNITLEFLRTLNEAVACQVARFKDQLKIITIDSVLKNFADDEMIKSEILQRVDEALVGQR